MLSIQSPQPSLDLLLCLWCSNESSRLYKKWSDRRAAPSCSSTTGNRAANTVMRHDGRAETDMAADKPSTVSIAAQKGVHLRSQDWHPQLSEQLLLGLVARDRSTLIINDTSTIPEMKLPLLDDGGTPRRPGSVLGIPIFEPTLNRRLGDGISTHRAKNAYTTRVLGTIEVYHRRARGFPAEEVELLEQFAQQAGLAIQNARLFLRIDQLAKDASRNLRRREYIMQAIPDAVIFYDSSCAVV